VTVGGLGTAFDRLVAGVVPRLPRALVARASSPYIAGATLEDAVLLVGELNAAGRTATLDVLGEEVRTEEESDAIAAEYHVALVALGRAGLRSGLSVKPTAMGLMRDPERALARISAVVAAAESAGRFVRLDMEDSSTIDRTLELHARLRAEGHTRVGVVLQAMLHRTLADADALGRAGADVRLCKGIYLEPASIAYRDASAIRKAFTVALTHLLEGGARVGIATHDERLVDEAVDLVRSRGIGTDRYEFQMLLGVRPSLGDRLVADGHRLRVYVPYGARWYEYSIRRLRENPAVAGQVFRAVARDPRVLLG
jgi:proline dehydrogenase